MALPTNMQALRLESFDGPEGLFVREVEVPTPRAGQVLVKMRTAAVNPSDLMFLRGRYGVRREPPTTPGFEGCGVVVASGSGFGQMLIGRRVSCAAQGEFGTWAEYTIASATSCFPLRNAVNDDQGAMMLVNPLTAWAMLDTARRAGHHGVVINAANSALGRMIIRVAAVRGMPTIAIVRSDTYVAELTALGATQVLVSSEADFGQQLREASERLKTTMAFDAIAGAQTGELLNAMPRGAHVLVYGALSLSPVQVDVGTLLFGQRRVEGFWLSEWITKYGMRRVIPAMIELQTRLLPAIETIPIKHFGLADAAAGIRAYQDNMGAGKIILQLGF